jgi:hypothetical protein
MEINKIFLKIMPNFMNLYKEVADNNSYTTADKKRDFDINKLESLILS